MIDRFQQNCMRRNHPKLDNHKVVRLRCSSKARRRYRWNCKTMMERSRRRDRRAFSLSLSCSVRITCSAFCSRWFAYMRNRARLAWPPDPRASTSIMMQRSRRNGGKGNARKENRWRLALHSASEKGKEARDGRLFSQGGRAEQGSLLVARDEHYCRLPGQQRKVPEI